MTPSRLLLALVILVGVTACGSGDSGLAEGQVDSRTYRSAAAQVGDYTLRQARDDGFVDSPFLGDRFLREGGADQPGEATCLYAQTLYRRTTADRSYRGTARLCFDAAGKLVSAERSRADLNGTPSPPALP